MGVAVFGSRRLIGLKKTEAPQLFHELVKCFGWNGGFDLGFEPLVNGLQRRRAVELSSDQLLGFSKPKEASGRRVLHDERNPLRRLLSARDQIAAQLRTGRRHVSARAVREYRRLQSEKAGNVTASSRSAFTC